MVDGLYIMECVRSRAWGRIETMGDTERDNVEIRVGIALSGKTRTVFGLGSA